jgi:hypothetical protein
MHIHMYMHVYINMPMHIHMYICTYVHMYIHIPMHIQVCKLLRLVFETTYVNNIGLLAYAFL